VIVGVLTSILGLTVSLLPYGYDLEESIGLGLLFKLRGKRQAPPEVVVIALDKESAAQLKLPSDHKQWPRSYHARLIQTLADEGVRVIAFDLMFDEARLAAEDRVFANALREARNVVLLGYLEREAIPLKDRSGRVTGEMTVDRMRPPTSVLAQEAAAFAPLPLPKVPVTVSQFWTFKDSAGDFPTMPVAAFQMFALPVYDDLINLLQKALEDPRIAQAKETAMSRASIVEAQRLVGLKKEDFEVPGAVHGLIRSLKEVLGDNVLLSEIMMRELENPTEPPLDADRTEILKALLNMYKDGNSRYLNFYGPARTITTVPYFQALQLPQPVVVNGKAVDFKGKVVFIGASDIYPYQQGDTYRTVFSQPNGLDLSGVEIGATAFANLLEDLPIRPIDFRVSLLTILLFGIAVGMLCFLLRPFLALVCSVGLIIVFVGIAYYQFKIAGIWAPVIVPLGVQGPFAFVAAVSWKYFDTRKLEVAHAQLKEVDRLKSMFLSHVSHELKTPLTSIKGFVDNMLDGLTGELQGKQQDYLRRIRANTDRLARMITNLLDLSRIESGTHRLDRVQLRLFEPVVEVVEQCRPMAACKQITLEMVCPDPTIQVLADPDKVVQVLINLVDNAIKYTPSGGKITIAIARRDPERVMMTVTDTGGGIPAEAMAKLFEPFYQASQQPGTRGKGLGLGLSIVKTLVELHGGTVSVTSEVGKGSEFCILMPALKQGDT
jgi:signal transduction histidine kinase